MCELYGRTVLYGLGPSWLPLVRFLSASVLFGHMFESLGVVRLALGSLGIVW